MSQPIHLYDKDGNAVTLYAPTTAAELVEAGDLFEEQPESDPLPDWEIAVTPPDIHDLKLSELRQMAKRMGLSASGNKAALTRRILGVD